MRCSVVHDDIVSVDEFREWVNAKLKQRRHEFESQGFKLSRTIIEYMKCNFSTNEITRDII